MGVYTGPIGLLSEGSKELGTGFTISNPHSLFSPLACLAPMLRFISCSYTVNLGREPED